MKRARLRPALSVVALLLLAPALALAGAKVKFGQITMADGLPEDGILCVLQDRQGFLWIGTQNGLVRYDGYEFRTFKPDPDDPGSIGGRFVMALHEDRDGTLWVGTRRGGLNRFDRETQRFHRYRHDPDDPTTLGFDAVGAIFEDSRGILWVGTGDFEEPDSSGGLHRLDRASGRFTRYRHDPDDPTSLSHNVVMEIEEDPAGAIWVATAGGGLNRMEAQGGSFTRWGHDNDDRGSLAHDWVFDLAVDADGRLWAATADGLDRLDAARGRFHHYQADPETRGALASNAISRVYADPEGTLWVGTWAGVLHRYLPESDSFYRYEPDPEDPRSLTVNQGVSDIMRDRSEILWIATWRGGLAKLDKFARKFPHFGHEPDDPNSLSHDLVSSFAEDRAGNIWIGTRGGGLNRFNPRSETFTRFRHDRGEPGSLASDTINALLVDSTGSLWVGTHGGGLDRFNPGTGSFSHYRHDPDDPESLASNWVHALLETDDGRLWVGLLESGLSLLDRASGRFVHFRHDPEDPHTLGHDTVRVLRQDSAGTVWVGTESGLNRYDSATGRFTEHSDHLLGLDTVWSIHEDRRGRLWVGTFNGGLHLFDQETGVSRPFNQRHGLAHDSVYHILEDEEGKLWLSTGFGLSRFDPDLETFRNYDEADGLASHRFDGGGVHTGRGELLFGSNNGINAFFPRDVKDNPYPPQVVLTDFQIFNRSVEPGSPGSPLGRHISETAAISLSHRDWMITFEFAALHFGNPEKNRFAYRLLPLEQEWRSAGGYRHAKYTNLEPGEYEFQVKAANGDGVWNEAGTSVQLTIQPPWWRTWWAWAAYAVAGLVGLISTDRLQRRRLVRRERARAREEHSRLRAEAAELQAKAAEAQARALHVENERKTLELEQARQMQLSLLPEELPRHPDLAIAAYMKTATEVGGDFYDFDLADDGTLTVAIGDATGHGTRAGMIVTATKVLFKLLAADSTGVELLGESTRALKQLNLPNLFMALSIVRVEGRRLELSGAGMPPVLIRRAADGSVDEIATEGAPLGSFADFPYETRRAELEPGDTVVMMSDGLPETQDPRGDLLGYQRVAEVLRDSAAEAPPQELIEHLAGAAASWAQGQPATDDLTLVVLQLRQDGAARRLRPRALP